MIDISVFGAGAFGTALAISLADDGRNVTLIARDAGHANMMSAARSNTARLPGHSFPPTLMPVSDPTKITDICLIAVPTQKLAAFMARNTASFANKILVACCKGVDLTSGKGPTDIISTACPSATAAILSGPSFATDIAAGLPTALTLAVQDPVIGKSLQKILSTSNLRLYQSSDVKGVELGGALKNVIAIAAGVTIGAGLGESARAALMTRGYAEMKKFSVGSGALPETLSGLSGFGDLVLTCTSEKSRNFSFGQRLGQGDTTSSNVTVEGVATAKAVSNMANTLNIDMPVTDAVSALLDQKITVAQAVEMLLSRPLKKE